MPIFLGVLFVIVCILLVIVVLLQKGRGGGLGAAFGGAGTAAFGTRTGDVFTWVTIILTGLFLLLAIGTTVVYRPPTPKAANPEFSHGGGPIAGPTNVVIRGERGTDVYYTLDGSEPTKDSTKFQDVPFEVKPGMTAKARAFASRGEPSDIVTAEFFKPSPATKTATTLPEKSPATKATTAATRDAATKAAN